MRYDSRKKSTTIDTVKHTALLLTAAWILWNHTINPDSSQETWTPLSQFKTKSVCAEAAQGIVKKHIS
jgi:cytochrome c oxidase assembly factor CtaG